MDLWLSSCKLKFSAQLAPLWKMAIISAFWIIWRVQNLAFFEDQLSTIHYALNFIWTSIREANSLSSGSMSNNADELLILHALRISCRPSKAPKILEVRWCPSPPGWIKVNTDGSAFGYPGLEGVVGIF